MFWKILSRTMQHAGLILGSIELNLCKALRGICFEMLSRDLEPKQMTSFAPTCLLD